MHDRFDVAIVGLGPAGASLANLPGQAGLSMERWRENQAVARPGFKNMRFVNASSRQARYRSIGLVPAAAMRSWCSLGSSACTSKVAGTHSDH